MVRSRYRSSGFGNPYKYGTRNAGRYGTRKKRQSQARRRKYRINNRRIGGFMDIETKFLDTGIGATTIAAGTAWGPSMRMDPTGLCLNATESGSGPSERIGRHITMSKLTVRGTVCFAAGALLDSPRSVKLVVLMDKQTNGTTYDPAQVFVNPSGSSLGAPHPEINLEYKDRFTILGSRLITHSIESTYDSNPSGTAIPFDSPEEKSFSLSIPLRGLKCLYRGTANPPTVAQISDHSIHVCAIVSDAATTTSLIYNSRLSYTG